MRCRFVNPSSGSMHSVVSFADLFNGSMYSVDTVCGSMLCVV